MKLERRVATQMGTTLYPPLAEVIARDRYTSVQREYPIAGELPSTVAQAIDTIVNQLRAPGQGRGAARRRPNHFAELAEIEAARRIRTPATSVSTIADLFVEDYAEGPLFLEIKSPMPNLDICAESKKKMLVFQALNHGRRPQAYLGFPYDPFYPERYGHSFTRQIMDMQNEVLLGRQFWDKLGGTGAYETLLSIIEEVIQEGGGSQSSSQLSLG